MSRRLAAGGVLAKPEDRTLRHTDLFPKRIGLALGGLLLLVGLCQLRRQRLDLFTRRRVVRDHGERQGGRKEGKRPNAWTNQPGRASV